MRIRSTASWLGGWLILTRDVVRGTRRLYRSLEAERELMRQMDGAYMGELQQAMRDLVA